MISGRPKPHLAKHVFPYQHSGAVDPGRVQLARVVVLPTIDEVQHVLPLDPLVPGQTGRTAIAGLHESLSPRHVVVVYVSRAQRQLALQRHARPGRVQQLSKAGGAAVQRVQKNTVRVNRRHQFGQHVQVVPRLAPCALVPGIVIDQHLDPRLVQTLRQFPQARQPARHVAIEVKLIPPVETDSWICVPQNDAVKAPKPLPSVLQQSLGCETIGLPIPQHPVPEHDEPTIEIVLSPLELRTLVERVVVADAVPNFVAPDSQSPAPRVPLTAVRGRVKHHLPTVDGDADPGWGLLSVVRRLCSEHSRGSRPKQQDQYPEVREHGRFLVFSF